MLRRAQWAVVLCCLAATPALAYEGDHYAWTYYLALHTGFTERQAFQIASAAYAIDWDPQTGPMGTWGDWYLIATGEPSAELRAMWVRFHAFTNNLFAELPGEVEAAKSRHEQHLRDLATAQQNPGPLIHFRQDRFAHFGWWDVRGHAFAGHLPDFLADDADSAWQMTLATLHELAVFRQTLARHGEAAPRVPDLARIKEVFDRLLAANRVPPGSPPSKEIRSRLPHELQASTEALVGAAIGVSALEYVATVLVRYYPDVNVVEMVSKAPLIDRSVRVINEAVRDDKIAGLLPYFPDQEYGMLPAAWEQFDFDSTGKVSSAAVEGAFGVESPELVVGDPVAEYREASSSPSGAITVELMLPYELRGLKKLAVLHPLPVLEISETNDFGVGGKNRRYVENGSYTFERTIQRSRADLDSGRVTWKATIHAYGFEPVVRELTLDGEQAEPISLTALEELRKAAGAAIARARAIHAACDTVGQALASAARGRTEVAGRLDAAEQSLAAQLSGQTALIDRAARAEALGRAGERAAEGLAELRDSAGLVRDRACAPDPETRGWDAAAAEGMKQQADTLLAVLRQNEAALRSLEAALEAALVELGQLAEELAVAGASLTEANDGLGRAEEALADGVEMIRSLRDLEVVAAGLRSEVLEQLANADQGDDSAVRAEVEALLARVRGLVESAPSCLDGLQGELDGERAELARLVERIAEAPGQLDAAPLERARADVDDVLAGLEASRVVSELFVESILNRIDEALSCSGDSGAGTAGEPAEGGMVVPNLIGSSQDLGVTWLSDLGLQVTVRRLGPAPDVPRSGTIGRQAPAAGATAERGEAATLWVYGSYDGGAAGPEPDQPPAEPSPTIDQTTCNERWPGTVLTSDTRSGSPVCLCPAGTAWSGVQSACMSLADGDADSRIAVCSARPGTLQDPVTGECRCPVGVWDASQGGCIDVTAGERNRRIAEAEASTRCENLLSQIRTFGSRSESHLRAVATRAARAARSAGCDPGRIIEAETANRSADRPTGSRSGSTGSRPRPGADASRKTCHLIEYSGTPEITLLFIQDEGNHRNVYVVPTTEKNAGDARRGFAGLPGFRSAGSYRSYAAASSAARRACAGRDIY